MHSYPVCTFCVVQYLCNNYTFFSVESFGVEVPACTELRCRLFVLIYLRVELGGVESLFSHVCLETIFFNLVDIKSRVLFNRLTSNFVWAFRIWYIPLSRLPRSLQNYY